MPAKTPSPVVLTGERVMLEPLNPGHVDGLFAAGGRDEEVWQWLTAATPHSSEQLAVFLDARMREAAAGRRVVFAVVDRWSGQPVGTTNLHGWSEENEFVENGGTWLARSAWGTGVNTECKLLLLSHLFEDLGMGRVVWQTDVRNVRAQRALTRIGAQHEGIHRRVRRTEEGEWRDCACFSLLVQEWPEAKARLAGSLAR